MQKARSRAQFNCAVLHKKLAYIQKKKMVKDALLLLLSVYSISDALTTIAASIMVEWGCLYARRTVENSPF